MKNYRIVAFIQILFSLGTAYAEEVSEGVKADFTEVGNASIGRGPTSGFTSTRQPSRITLKRIHNAIVRQDIPKIKQLSGKLATAEKADKNALIKKAQDTVAYYEQSEKWRDQIFTAVGGIALATGLAMRSVELLYLVKLVQWFVQDSLSTGSKAMPAEPAFNDPLHYSISLALMAGGIGALIRSSWYPSSTVQSTEARKIEYLLHGSGVVSNSLNVRHN